MKRIIILVVALISLFTTQAQTVVKDSTSQFQLPLSTGSFVFDKETARIWQITQKATPTGTLATTTKREVTSKYALVDSVLQLRNDISDSTNYIRTMVSDSTAYLRTLVTDATGVLAQQWTALDSANANGNARTIASNGTGTIVSTIYSLGVEYIVRSTDYGQTWERSISATSLQAEELFYFKGRFIAIGGLKMHYSTDGLVWTTAATFTRYYQIAAASDNYIVAAWNSSSGTTYLAYTSNGVDWTEYQTNVAPPFFSIVSIASNEFLLVQPYSTGIYSFNPSTETFALKSSIDEMGAMQILGDASKLCILVNTTQGATDNYSFVSTDAGLTWTKSLASYPNGNIYRGNNQVMHGSCIIDGTFYTQNTVDLGSINTSYIMSSYDGIIWSMSYTEPGTFFRSMYFDGNILYARNWLTGSTNSNVIAYLQYLKPWKAYVDENDIPQIPYLSGNAITIDDYNVNLGGETDSNILITPTDGGGQQTFAIGSMKDDYTNSFGTIILGAGSFVHGQGNDRTKSDLRLTGAGFGVSTIFVNDEPVLSTGGGSSLSLSNTSYAMQLDRTLRNNGSYYASSLISLRAGFNDNDTTPYLRIRAKFEQVSDMYYKPFRGLQYEHDYSVNYDERSLPDVGWVNSRLAYPIYDSIVTSDTVMYFKNDTIYKGKTINPTFAEILEENNDADSYGINNLAFLTMDDGVVDENSNGIAISDAILTNSYGLVMDDGIMTNSYGVVTGSNNILNAYAYVLGYNNYIEKCDALTISRNDTIIGNSVGIDKGDTYISLAGYYNNITSTIPDVVNRSMLLVSDTSNITNCNNFVGINLQNKTYENLDNTTVIDRELLLPGVVSSTAPASATDTGIKGEIRITATHIYVCVDTNTWVRSELTTW